MAPEVLEVKKEIQRKIKLHKMKKHHLQNFVRSKREQLISEKRRGERQEAEDYLQEADPEEFRNAPNILQSP